MRVIKKQEIRKGVVGDSMQPKEQRDRNHSQYDGLNDDRAIEFRPGQMLQIADIKN